MKRANTMDRDKIREALENTPPFDGITGKIIFDKNRNPVKNAVINEINNGKIKYFETISSAPNRLTDLLTGDSEGCNPPLNQGKIQAWLQHGPLWERVRPQKPNH